MLLAQKKRTSPAITTGIDRRCVKYSAASRPESKRISPNARSSSPQLLGEEGDINLSLFTHTR